jgi:trehalose 2-sulfotransferase
VSLWDSPDGYGRWVLEPPRPRELLRPRDSYFVCATPRCGSWFLCGLLASTGVAGRPHEWFWRDTRASLERRWDVSGADEYVELILAAGTTANGVFAAKVMFGSLPDLAAFPRPRYVWMRRRDRVAQAVSFARAVQTGHWHHWDPPAREEPVFRLDAVDALLREIDELERSWAGWFEREGIEPLEVAYEDVAAAPQRETRRVLDFLSLELPPGIAVRPLTLAQRAPVGEDWAARYRDERHHKT